MKRSSLLIMAALSAVLATGCKPELVIVHVNDTHSHLEPLREDSSGGIIERGAIIDSIVAVHGRDNVLLLHAGDFNQGSAYYTHFKGEAELAAFNAFGYDCVCLGNHEFDDGLEHLAGRLARICCPVVCANVDLSATPLAPYVQPCAIVKKAGRTIGIIGAAPNLFSVVISRVRGNIKMCEDDASVINSYAEKLAKKCDLVVLLSHMGYKEDQELAARLHHVDLIVGGHSHTNVSDIIEVPDADGKPVRIITDGMWGLTIGEITIRQ